MYNIIGIGRFLKSVTNCDRLQIQKVDQLHKFYCKSKFKTEAFLVVNVRTLFQGKIRSNGS